MSDFCTEGSVVHEENIEVLDVVNQELFKSIG